MRFMLTIKEMKNTRIPDDYYGFSVKDFMDSKTLRIENVKKSVVMGKNCIKIDTRIIKDKDGTRDKEGRFTPYNEGKVITIRVENDDEDIYDSQLMELKQSIGNYIEIDVDIDLIGVYFYQQNILTVIVSDFKTGEKDKNNIQNPQMKDRPLKGLAEYRQFDITSFLQNESLRLKGMMTEGKKGVIFNGFIDNENVVSIHVPVKDAESLPADLITINTDFVASVKDYGFENVTASHYGTRWTFYFNHLTFQSGVIGNDNVTVGRPSEGDTSESNAKHTNITPEQI